MKKRTWKKVQVVEGWINKNEIPVFEYMRSDLGNNWACAELELFKAKGDVYESEDVLKVRVTVEVLE